MIGCDLIPTTATLSAAPTPGSSWARTKKPCCASGGKSAARKNPFNLSSVLIGQFGHATEYLNRRWYELNSGHRIFDIQRHAVHRTMPWMAAALVELVKKTGAVFEAKFTPSSSFSEEAAAEKHMAQLQHEMLVAGTKKCVLSIIDGGGKWIELSIEADPIYQTILVAAEKSFWRRVKTGEPPALFDCEPPKPRIKAVRVVDIVTH
jgi:predicted phage-related endonuclease